MKSIWFLYAARPSSRKEPKIKSIGKPGRSLLPLNFYRLVVCVNEFTQKQLMLVNNMNFQNDLPEMMS